MPMTVRSSPAASSAFAAQMKQAMGIEVGRVASTVSQRAITLARSYASNELNVRPASRRHKGSLRYENGFSARTSGFALPITVTLSNRAPHANIIENGSSPHGISGAPLALPGRVPSMTPGVSPIDVNGGAKRNTLVNSVNHLGTKPRKIMERALVQAWKEQGVAIRRHG